MKDEQNYTIVIEDQEIIAGMQMDLDCTGDVVAFAFIIARI